VTADTSLPAIDVTSVREMLATNPDALVVDVRTPGEFETAHISGAINLPLDQVDAHLARIVNDAGGQMVLVCQSGNRAGQACRKLAGAGLTGSAVMTGGMNDWIAAGNPVVRGRERWALERQVRLVAGTIVLLSVLASILVPGAQIVAGLVGAGLAIAALTNTCAMGALLSRLPYNRGPGHDPETALVRLRQRAADG
jgi:rhodanese-related sulfurtransferase